MACLLPLQGHLAKLKESLQRRLSEQQQAVLHSNYSLLSLAAGRLEATRDLISTCQERCATSCLMLSHIALLHRCGCPAEHCVANSLPL